MDSEGSGVSAVGHYYFHICWLSTSVCLFCTLLSHLLGKTLSSKLFTCFCFVLRGIIIFSFPIWCSGQDVPLHLLFILALLHSEKPKLYTILAFLSAKG